MKHGNTFYIELSREIFTPKYSDLSQNAKWLFVVLNELEQRFTGSKKDFFFRTNEDLTKDTGMSMVPLKKAKADLMKTKLIEVKKCHFRCEETGKLSEKRVTTYKILAGDGIDYTEATV